MLVIYYFRWAGTAEEYEEYVRRFKNIADGIKGCNLKGAFTPINEWDDVLLFESTSFDNVLKCFSEYIQNFGPHPKVTLDKIEPLFTIEEFGYEPLPF